MTKMEPTQNISGFFIDICGGFSKVGVWKLGYPQLIWPFHSSPTWRSMALSRYSLYGHAIALGSFVDTIMNMFDDWRCLPMDLTMHWVFSSNLSSWVAWRRVDSEKNPRRMEMAWTLSVGRLLRPFYHRIGWWENFNRKARSIWW